MLQDFFGVLLMIAWTPPFFGMILLMLLGGWLGLVIRLPKLIERLFELSGLVVVVLFFLRPALGLYLIPMVPGWVGWMIGHYYNYKLRIIKGDD